jgi:hypothetical protein
MFGNKCRATLAMHMRDDLTHSTVARNKVEAAARDQLKRDMAERGFTLDKVTVFWLTPTDGFAEGRGTRMERGERCAMMEVAGCDTN